MTAKKLSEVFIDVEGEQVPVKLFLTQMKKNYVYCVEQYDKMLNKLVVGKLRKKTREKLIQDVQDLQNEMIEIGGVYRAAFEYAKKEGVIDEILEDKFLNDSRQLTDEQKEQLEKEEKDREAGQSRYDKYMEHFKMMGVPSQQVSQPTQKELEESLLSQENINEQM